MPKWIKIFSITVLIIFIIISTLTVIVYKNLDQLKQLAIQKVNKSLKTELVAKSLDISFLHTLPDVSLTLNDVQINDPIRPKEVLISAKHIYFGFNIYKIFRKNYQVQLLKLDSAKLNLFIDAAGRSNFDIMKEKIVDDNEKNQSFHFKLTKLQFSSVHLLYHHQNQQFRIESFIESGTISGNFTDKMFDLEAKINSNIILMESAGIPILKDINMLFNTTLSVNLNDNSYKISKSECKMDEMQVSLEGTIKDSGRGTIYDLVFNAKTMTIQSLMSIMPYKLSETLKAYKSEGKVYFRGTIKGIQKVREMPAIVVKFGIENGVLSDPVTKLQIDKINLTGSFSNGHIRSLKSAVFNISRFEANLFNQDIVGSMQVSNLEQPIIVLDMKGGADLNSLNQFFKFQDFEEISGNVIFTISLKCKKNDNKWDLSSPFNRGILKASISKLKLINYGAVITNLEADFLLNSEQLRINDLSLTSNRTSLSLKGGLPHMMKYLLGEDTHLTGDFMIVSKELNLEDFLLYNSSEDTGKMSKPISYHFNYSIDADKFIYKKFNSEQTKLQISVDPGRIEIPQFQMSTNGGNLSGKATIFTNNNQYVLKSNITSKGINMNELLKEFDNFGQKEFTSNNLFGTISAETELSMVWDEKMNFNSNKIVLVSDISIKNGQLMNYEPLNSLSRFVDINELNNLKFSDLKNTITIKDKVITIPAMEIKTNALNLTMSGTHTFENYLDYKIKLALSELLKKKRKPQANEFGEEDEKTNGMNLYIQIKGPVNNLKFTYDRKEVKRNINRDFTVEKETIREIIKQEFGIKKDTSLKKIEKKNDKDDELEFEAN